MNIWLMHKFCANKTTRPHSLIYPLESDHERGDDQVIRVVILLTGKYKQPARNMFEDSSTGIRIIQRHTHESNRISITHARPHVKFDQCLQLKGGIRCAMQ